MIRSFRSALIVFIVTAAILPVLMVSIPFVLKIYSMAREGAVKELRLSAERVAADMQHEIDFVYSRFVSIGRDKDMVLAVTSPFFGFRGITLSNEFLRGSPVVESSYLLDANLEIMEALPEATATADIGKVVLALRSRMPDPSVHRERAFWIVVEDAELIDQLARNRKERSLPRDKRILVLAMPLFFEHYVQERSNKMQGMLMALIPIERLTRQSQQNLEAYQDLSLLTGNGSVPEQEHYQNAQASLHIKSALPKPIRLQVQVSEPDAVRFRSVHLTLVVLSVFVATATILFSCLAFTMARRLGRPLDRIRQLAHEYAAANYRPPMEEIDFEEFQQIALALDKMGQRIENHLEELRTTNEQLLQADKLKDDFLANTSHELRTPLHGIIGIASSIIDGAAGELSPKLDKNLRLIEQSGKRLENLVNDILDISRIKNQALRLELKPVEIFSLVDVVVSLHATQAEKTGLTLINAVPRTLPLAQADEFRLQQILHNLVGNALKFSGHGEITVHAARQGDMLLISVSDSGIGIAHEKLKTIFEPFVQIEGALTRTHSGSGLGLTISRNLVELHGGSMMVESTLSRGSTFSFTLPVASDQNADTVVEISAFSGFDNDDYERAFVASEQLEASMEWSDASLEPAEPGMERRKAHVLMVDDENINIQILTNYFFDEPYILHIARNGPEALDLLDRMECVDLILLDVMMPKMSGYEVCCRVRVNPRFEHVPILFLTARNQAKDIHHGFYYGCNDYLVKPISRVELLTRCHYHLQYARAKNELAALNGELEKLVEARTEELRELLGSRQMISNIWRSLLNVSFDLQGPQSLVQRFEQSLDSMKLVLPEHDLAIIFDGNIYSRLPLKLRARLQLAMHENQAWRESPWLQEHGLTRLTISVSQGQELAELVVWPASSQADEHEVLEVYARQLALTIKSTLDLTEQERMSCIDILTLTFNRQFFEHAFLRINGMFARYPDRHFCLMCIEVDGLPVVNARYGHTAGDAVLVGVADVIRSVLRQTDILCRVSDDNFLLLVEATRYLQGTLLCERLRSAQQESWVDCLTSDGTLQRLAVRFSVGLATSEHIPPDAMLLAARQAMLQSRQRRLEDTDTKGWGGLTIDLVAGK